MPLQEVVDFKPELRSENGRSSVGSNFHSDSSLTETLVVPASQPNQQRIVEYVETSSGIAAINSVTSAGSAKKASNRPSGPRKPKPQVVVSTLCGLLRHVVN